MDSSFYSILLEEITSNGKALNPTKEDKKKPEEKPPEDTEKPKEDNEPNTDDTEDDVPDYGSEEDKPPDADTQTADDDTTDDTQKPEVNTDIKPQADDTDAPPDDGTDTDNTQNDGDTAEDDGDDVPDYGGDDTPDDGTDTDNTQNDGDAEEDDGEDTGDENSPDMTSNDIQELEKDVFSSLTPEQIAAKTTELKTQYVNLYDAIDKTVSKLSKVNRTNTNIKAINFSVKKLIELRELLKTSLVNNFDSKSYVENQIILQRHMLIYSSIIKIVEELGAGMNKNK